MTEEIEGNQSQSLAVPSEMDSEGKGCRQHFFAQPFFMPFGFFE
jgi:hypothetical protein